MPSASCPSAVPPVLSHQIWRAATRRPWPRSPCVTVCISTSSAMPNPLWRTKALPLCSVIWPLTLHSWPGIVTSPQFTLCASRACADAAGAVRTNPLVPVRAATAASDDTMSLIFVTGPLPWPCWSELCSAIHCGGNVPPLRRGARHGENTRQRPGLAAPAGDVVEMVHRVVNDVPGEGLDGEAGHVA